MVDNTPERKSAKAKARTVFYTVGHHIKNHVGIGVICSVAYFDPGNWSVDLQAGSQYGFKLLFVVLMAGIMAAVFQAMASRLGCVTGLDLATHCRRLFYNRPKWTKFYRWGILYPLYALSEIAIISTDLAELLGSATALVMLFPKLPLWAGVLITACDVVFILGMGDPTNGRPVKMFEYLIGFLTISVFGCLVAVIIRISPDWPQAFDGFLPSKTVFGPGALYISIGIVGATVMPHGLFLGSSLAKQDRIQLRGITPSEESLQSLPMPAQQPQRSWIRRMIAKHLTTSMIKNAEDDFQDLSGKSNNPESFVKAHLYHGIVDVVASLLGFAVIINAAILVLGSAVFFNRGGSSDAGLFEAHDLISSFIGKAGGVLFALALLSAGQSASITATLAGQVVSEGFIHWHVPPVLRRLLTRLLGLVPSMIVAAGVGQSGIDSLLVISQVILSIVLPFVALPLVWLTSNRDIMRVRKETIQTLEVKTTAVMVENNEIDLTSHIVLHSGASPTTEDNKSEKESISVSGQEQQEEAPVEYIYYHNSRPVMWLGYFIWLLMLIANGYVIITLILGYSG